MKAIIRSGDGKAKPADGDQVPLTIIPFLF